ncbi:hypothetical protein LCGC14_0531200 [marine sediment metagenome]|uniref:Uncharacterized protein n=1 Tax=marine sediment metagenome TaxID=412755 RepID=A0A0F9S080_9ZZZZ
MECVKELIAKRVDVVKTSLKANQEALRRMLEDVAKKDVYIQNLMAELAEYKKVWELIEDNG